MDGHEARGGTRDGAGSHSRDWLVPVLLLFMWDAGSYDSRLQERLGELGLDGTGPEEMYRTFGGWNGRGWSSATATVPGSRSRVGGTRPLGRAYLESWADSLEGCQGEIDLFLKTYADGSARETR